jgi:hypothetical protein
VNRSVPPSRRPSDTPLIELPANEHVSLVCDVVRTAGATGEVALRFQPTNVEVASIDRLVFSTVKRNNSTGG